MRPFRAVLALAVVLSLLGAAGCKSATEPAPPETLYQLTVAVSPSNAGTVARAPDQAQYDPGTVVTLTATPAAGYVFTRWAGDVSGTANPAAVTMSANRTVSAVFTSTTPRFALNVAISPSTGGTVARTPDLGEYEPGTVVTLTATPAAGYAFTRWEGDASGAANPTTVTMDAARSVVAVFTPTAYYTLAVTVSPVDGGTVARSPDQVEYAPGTVVTLTATPASGFAFSRWDGGLTGTSNPAAIAMSGDRSVTAIFTETDTPVLRLSPEALAFTAVRGQPAPSAQAVAITNVGGGTLDGLARSYPDGKPDWLTATLGGSIAPATLTVEVSLYDRFGHPLAAGTYTSRVAVSSPAAANSPQDVEVTFTILAETTQTFFAAFDNTVRTATDDASEANMVFYDTPLEVGVDYVAGASGYDVRQAASALLFDVQTQIAGRTIARAILRLHVHAVRGDLAVSPLVRVSAFATLWNPATLTWNAWRTMQVQATGASSQAAPSSAALPFDFDVTAIVRNWASGAWLNHGFQVDFLNHAYPGSTSLQKTRFQSLEVYADPARRPKLIVEFQ